MTTFLYGVILLVISTMYPAILVAVHHASISVTTGIVYGVIAGIVHWVWLHIHLDDN